MPSTSDQYWSTCLFGLDSVFWRKSRRILDGIKTLTQWWKMLHMLLPYASQNLGILRRLNLEGLAWILNRLDPNLSRKYCLQLKYWQCGKNPCYVCSWTWPRPWNSWSLSWKMSFKSKSERVPKKILLNSRADKFLWTVFAMLELYFLKNWPQEVSITVFNFLLQSSFHKNFFHMEFSSSSVDIGGGIFGWSCSCLAQWTFIFGLS